MADAGRRRCSTSRSRRASAVVPVLLAVLLVVAWRASARRRTRGARRRPSRQRAPGRRAQDVRARHRPPRRVVRGRRRRRRCSPAFPQCSAEWQGRERACRPRAQPGRRHARRCARAGRADRARSSRELDDALLAHQHAGQSARRRCRSASTSRAGREAARDALAHAGRVAATIRAARSRVRCADLARAVRTLARADARMLARARVARHRGRAHGRALAARPVRRDLARARSRARNPWAGIAGLRLPAGARRRPRVDFVVERDARHRRARVHAATSCDAQRRDAAPSRASPASRRPTWPPTIRAGRCRRRCRAMLQPLEPLQPSGGDGVPRASSRERPTASRSTAARVDVGFSIDLTIDPALQALAQRTAACYTGRQDVCRALGIARKEDEGKPIGHRAARARDGAHGRGRDHRRRERAHRGARRRAVAVHARGVRRPGPLAALRHAPAVSDPLSSRRAAQSRRVPRCDAGVDDQADHGGGVPVRSRRRARAGSPPSARRCARTPCAHAATACAAQLHALGLGALSRSHVLRRRELPALRAAVGRSRRPRRAFGWNADCARASERCGKRDLLFGAVADARDDGGARRSRSQVPYGRLLVEPASGAPARRSALRTPVALDAAKVSRCAAGPDGRRGDAGRLGEVPRRHRRRRRRRRLGTGPCALDRARRRGHDGDARRGGERADRRARSRISCARCAASRARRRRRSVRHARAARAAEPQPLSRATPPK